MTTKARTLGSKIFTTGQVARLAGVSPLLATKWMDAGLMPSYRLPGWGGTQRRVKRADLLAFLRAHNLPGADVLENLPPGEAVPRSNSRGLKSQAGRDVLTTGQAAKFLNVAARSVQRWVDLGILRGYALPGGKNRRIWRSDLVRFMRQHDMTGVEAVAAGLPPPVLLVGLPPALAESLRRALGKASAVEQAEDGFEAGAAAARRLPCVAVLDLRLGRWEACGIARRLAALRGWRGRLVALQTEDGGGAADLDAAGFACVLTQPVDPARLADCVRNGVTHG